MYIVYIVHETNKKKVKKNPKRNKPNTVTSFLREVYLPPGTELIPLFPYLRAGLKKEGGQHQYIPGNRVLVTDHRLTGFLTPS